MSYKISDTAMIIESDGKSILIADETQYVTSLSVGSTVQDLDADYFTNYFFTGFGGSTSGYSSGGGIPAGPGRSDVIDKFPFSSDANATDVGNLTTDRSLGSVGNSSDANGYSAGGSNPAPPYQSNVIDKFPFSSNANATDVGDLTAVRMSGAGQSSTANGYHSGGTLAPDKLDIIDKFPFSSDANATDVGDLTLARAGSGGQSSASNGYTSGGDRFPFSDAIDKFPFATDANATDVGDMTNVRYYSSGQGSGSNGYTAGGYGPPFSVNSGYKNEIDKFPFATDANATGVGDLTVIRNRMAGQSSLSDGYAAGGESPIVDTIDKFPFSSDANATDVGNLTQGRYGVSGQQV